MAFLDQSEVHDAYVEAKTEADVWRKDYKEYERLADNGLLADLDPNLPEVNDGSLAASLFKLPKRIVSSNLTGRAKALDVDDAWITELANLQWENNIVPNANSQAPFHRKWKDAVRKAAIYGGQPIITLFVERGNYVGSDFIVPQAQDVKLEAGKVSDYDSDVIFWDVYYTQSQVKGLIEQAKKEQAEGSDGVNKWDIKALERILAAKQEEDRDSLDEHNEKQNKAVKKSGIHFYVAFQRGVDAPFYMCHKGTKSVVREWTNPDPTGDLPVHYLYCYQDFVNPYGIGIVKLAGGTQNVLDYMRQADVKATQLGIEPPVDIKGDADSVDLDSLVYQQRAMWFTGNATVTPVQTANQVYQQLPERISMYKTSLNQLIPTGDTSISAGAGDPQYSKTPAGVKFQQAALSIDDEDFKDNLYMTYEAVAKSMINTHFANMQGTDLMKLNDDERDLLMKSGLEFPIDEEGNPSNELEILWDEARATFDFEVDAELDQEKDDEKSLEGLMKVLELRSTDPAFDQKLAMDGYKLKDGELLTEIIGKTTDNKDIIEKISPEDQAAMEEEQMLAEQAMQEQAMGQEMPQEMPEEQLEQPELPEDDRVIQVMERFPEMDEGTARAVVAGMDAGFSAEEVMEAADRHLGAVNG